MKKITYIFVSGRKDNFLIERDEADEFYYGAKYLKSTGYKVEIIEFDKANFSKKNPLIYIDKFLNKILNIPSYMHKLINLKNFKRVKKTEHLILVNESVGFSAIPFLIYLKFRKTEVTMFIMGLYSKKISFPKIFFLHKLYIKFLILFIDNLLILGQEEYEIAKKTHKINKKIVFFPFCIDHRFWTSHKKFKLSTNSDILFVGNDGMRDFILLKEIAIELPHFDFVYISENEYIQNLNLSNVRVIRGNWGKKVLTDIELKNEYLKSRFLILPLVESNQPSGQSVALQSMSLGIPVLISKTKGFWDKENFQDKQDIIFVNPNSLENWVKNINEIYNNLELLEKISHNSKKIVQSKYNLDLFCKRLTEIIEN